MSGAQSHRELTNKYLEENLETLIKDVFKRDTNKKGKKSNKAGGALTSRDPTASKKSKTPVPKTTEEGPMSAIEILLNE